MNEVFPDVSEESSGPPLDGDGDGDELSLGVGDEDSESYGDSLLCERTTRFCGISCFFFLGADRAFR